MTLEEDRIKSLAFDYPELIPVSANILPAAWMKYRDALSELVARHAGLFGVQPGARDYDAVHTETYVRGEHIDVWGCVWSNLKTGMEAIVTGHPVPTRADVHDLQIPEEDVGFPHGFMYLRLQDLRGFEELMIDFAEEPPELQMLIDKVLRYNLRQARLKLAALEAQDEADPIVRFGDDLGMQQRLPISPQKWRQYLKPCYAEIYQPFREAGYYVYMHSDGHITEIIPDLVDCGVNVINPQVGANGLETLAEVCKGKVCVDLDLDRQLFPFASPEEIEDHVRAAVETLGAPEGGLWLMAEIGEDVPLRNIAAIFDALERYRGY
ncbi:MAG: uroporphyrinogen decarboxylase family protein, partial [Anaerolineae bacterium]